MVSNFIMKKRWKWILPIFGLILFSAESVTSIRLNRQYRTPSKYFYWSFFLLDSDPLNRSIKGPNPAPHWGIWIDHGYLTKALMFGTLPAFVLGIRIVKGFASLGVSEVASFAVAMPLLIFFWPHFVGTCLDYWIRKRPKSAQHNAIR
jgi:hypothetical protein